jgi:hypothetical protein
MNIRLEKEKDIMDKIPSREEIIALAKQLATPIDFTKLEKAGVIKKQGAWFKVTNMKILPEYASRQIRSIKIDSRGNCYVQFPKSWKRAQMLYRKMRGKEYNQ